MEPHFQCAEQQVSPSKLTGYCACHTKRFTFWVLITYETSFPMRGATGVTIKPHQILRLSHKKPHILRRHHIWNLISNARSNWCHYPTSPNTAPATKNDTARFQRKSPKTGETSFPMRGRSEHDPSMIRPWKRKQQPASPPRLLFELTTSIFYWKIQRFAPNLTFKPSPNTAPATKSDTSTSRSTAPATKSDTWTSPSTAPATKSDTWTSPNTAPVTQKDSHSESSSHMKPHFQCAEQLVSLSNLTKYCACHEKWHCKISKKISKNRWNVISNAGTIRAWSEHDPTMIRPWKRKPQPASPPRLLFELTTGIFYWKIQRFAPNLTFKPSPNTAPATKSDTSTSQSTAPATKSDTWTSPSTAPATKSDIWTSPSTAPATKSDTSTSRSTAPATKSDTSTSRSTAPARKSDTGPSPSVTVLYSSLLNSMLYSTLLNSMLYSTLLNSTVLYCNWTVTELYCTLLYLTLLYLTLLYLTLLYLTLLYLTLLYLTLLYLTLLYWTLLYLTLLYLTLLYSTWLYSTWHYSTVLYSTWHYSTWHYSTWHYSTWHYSTWLYSTEHYSTWHYSTWHYSTWHYST